MAGERMDRLSVLAAGALAGGAAQTPEEAARFAIECLQALREANREDSKARGGAKLL